MKSTDLCGVDFEYTMLTGKSLDVLCKDELIVTMDNIIDMLDINLIKLGGVSKPKDGWRSYLETKSIPRYCISYWAWVIRQETYGNPTEYVFDYNYTSYDPKSNGSKHQIKMVEDLRKEVIPYKVNLTTYDNFNNHFKIYLDCSKGVLKTFISDVRPDHNNFKVIGFSLPTYSMFEMFAKNKLIQKKGKFAKQFFLHNIVFYENDCGVIKDTPVKANADNYHPVELSLIYDYLLKQSGFIDTSISVKHPELEKYALNIPQDEQGGTMDLLGLSGFFTFSESDSEIITSQQN
jgi:hypothetical protein